MRALARYHRIQDGAVLVAHDDLDLDAGVVRLKRSGGHGGHNGLRDLHAQLGSDQYRRVRLGIGHPGIAGEVTGYVLGKPPAEDRVRIEAAIEVAVEMMPRIVRGEFEGSMNVLHSR